MPDFYTVLQVFRGSVSVFGLCWNSIDTILLYYTECLFISVCSGKLVVIFGVEVFLVGRMSRDGVFLDIFPSTGRTFAVADTSLDVGYLLFGDFIVAGDETLPPEGEVLGQFAGVVEVEPYGTEGVGLSMYLDMTATANRVGLGNRLGEADIEEGEENVGTVADVVAGTLPLEHGLVEDTGGVEV